MFVTVFIILFPHAQSFVLDSKFFPADGTYCFGNRWYYSHIYRYIYI